MGGGFYDRDVGSTRRSSGRSFFEYEEEQKQRPPEERKVHPTLDIKGKARECHDTGEHPKTTPIVVALDLTRSRGKDTEVIVQKLPMFIGQLHLKGYVTDPEVLIAGLGDATCDKAPLQIGQFESDNKMDDHLANLWREEGGGGTGQESYELIAYYFAHKTKLDCLKRSRKAYLFFVGDEGFYPAVSRTQVKHLIGGDITEDIPSIKIFQELLQKYHTFFIYPSKPWQERKKDIDEEIKKRVEEAGGMYEGVDVRISLIWFNRNDLDLHVVAPSGEQIFYSHMKSRCHGELDVDRNVHGETTKPVENIRWPKGQAPKGTYKVFVQTYRFWDTRETPFKVEVDINGEVSHFENTASEKAVVEIGDNPDKVNSRANIQIGEFYFDPEQRLEDQLTADKYALYRDEVVKDQWANAIPPENILLIDDPKAIIDVMMGAIAVREGRNLEDYIVDMAGRGQTRLRREQTRKALEGLADSKAVVKVEKGALPSKDSGKKRKSKTIKL